jgi:transcriptional regulator with XRE-family HTH domain
MAINFMEIGAALKAYRLNAGLSPEDAAKLLGISRAALYNYESGGVMKLNTIEKLATLLDVSVQSLLGAGVEYYVDPVAYYQRKRELEENAEQVVVYFEPLSFVLTSHEYVEGLRTALIEGIPPNLLGHAKAVENIERVMAVLEDRRAPERQRNIVSLVSAIQVQRFLRTGLIGTYNLSPQTIAERRRLARAEVERTAALMENEQMGIQIGVIEDTMPNQTFQIFRERHKTSVAVSPFRLGEFPNIRVGVASITSASDAVTHYENLAANLWACSYKGSRGAALLRDLIAQSWPEGSRVTVRLKK